MVSVHTACAPIRLARIAAAPGIRAFVPIRWPERRSRRPEGQDGVDRQPRRWSWGRAVLRRPGRAGPRGLLRGRRRGRGRRMGTRAAWLGVTGEVGEVGEEGLARLLEGRDQIVDG